MLRIDQRIYVAGHRGLVGSALVRALTKRGYKNILTRTRQEMDLLDQKAVHAFLKAEKPDCILLAAAKVGGIGANMALPADFIYDNLVVETNIIHGAYKAGINDMLFLGSSCIYPRLAEQPIREEALLTGPLEPTNEPYAISKIAGISLCQSYNRQYGTKYRAVMPTNLYGPGDNFDAQSGHVLPSLITRFHEAKKSGASSVTLWGTGTPRREFLHCDDLADACLFLLESSDRTDLINIGTGEDIEIRELAKLIAKIVGYTGTILFDPSKPDGTPRKLLNVDRLRAAGWTYRTPLETGIIQTYEWFLANEQNDDA